MLPTPEADNPIDGLEFVHWYCVPGTNDPENNKAEAVSLQ